MLFNPIKYICFSRVNTKSIGVKFSVFVSVQTCLCLSTNFFYINRVHTTFVYLPWFFSVFMLTTFFFCFFLFYFSLAGLIHENGMNVYLLFFAHSNANTSEEKRTHFTNVNICTAVKLERISFHFIIVCFLSNRFFLFLFFVFFFLYFFFHLISNEIHFNLKKNKNWCLTESTCMHKNSI